MKKYTVHEDRTIEIYYAVFVGPISRRLAASTLTEALTEVQDADLQSWINEPATDAENDLQIDGAGMDETDFSRALKAAGCELVQDLAGGWSIWHWLTVEPEEYERRAQHLARKLILDDLRQAPKIPVLRDGETAVRKWWRSCTEAGDQDTLNAIRACGELLFDATDNLVRAWNELINHIVPEEE